MLEALFFSGFFSLQFSYGGNLLINVGPTSDGRIEPIFEERLTQLGSWLQINGKAVYSTSVWKFQNDTESGKIW